jgi:hypothetical protein
MNNDTYIYTDILGNQPFPPDMVWYIYNMTDRDNETSVYWPIKYWYF